MSYPKSILAVAILLVALVVLLVFLARSKSHQHIATHSATSVPLATKKQESQKPKPKPNIYAVVPGGAKNLEDAKRLLMTLKNTKAYTAINIEKLHLMTLATSMVGHVAFRVGEHVYLTKKMVTLPAGEIVFTDGNNIIRARCLNLFSPFPILTLPTAPLEPTEAELMDVPTPLIPVSTYTPGSPVASPPPSPPTSKQPTPIGAPVPPPVVGAPPSKGGGGGRFPFIPFPIPFPIHVGHNPPAPPPVLPPPVKTPVVTPEPTNDVFIVMVIFAAGMLIYRSKILSRK